MQMHSTRIEEDLTLIFLLHSWSNFWQIFIFHQRWIYFLCSVVFAMDIIDYSMMNKKKLIFGFIDREKPLTWIIAIIIAMLIIPLVVTFTLYYGMKP